jgi:ornithine cyclodeaminase
MLVLDAAATERFLPYPALIDALAEAFRDPIDPPHRNVHDVPVPGGESGILFTMPVWRAGRAIGVKLVTYSPANAARGLPGIHGTYVLFDGATGVPRAVLDGTVLTRRTAALAALHLARSSSATLLVVGTGALAAPSARAHAVVLPLQRVLVWGRDAGKAAAVAKELQGEAFAAETAPDLRAAVELSDVIVCATSSRTPLIHGDWLRPGQHLGLLGSFQAGMHETDHVAFRRARVFADTRAGVLAEAGEVLAAIERGHFASHDLAGELADLAAGRVEGRRTPDEITLFKSVGTAIADLAAAELAAGGAISA